MFVGLDGWLCDFLANSYEQAAIFACLGPRENDPGRAWGVKGVRVLRCLFSSKQPRGVTPMNQ